MAVLQPLAPLTLVIMVSTQQLPAPSLVTTVAPPTLALLPPATTPLLPFKAPRFAPTILAPRSLVTPPLAGTI